MSSSSTSFTQKMTTSPKSPAKLCIQSEMLDLTTRKRSIKKCKKIIPQQNKNYPLLFQQNYTLTKTILGKGGFCIVKKCIRNIDNKEFAVKIIHKKKLSLNTLESAKQEHKIVKRLHSKNKRCFINVIDTFENDKILLIILELCKGKTLFQYLRLLITEDNHYVLNETRMAFLFFQLAKAVHYCHKNNIVHRDIKPENILFKDETNTQIILTDFGLSHIGKSKMITKCGSPNYVAPEIILGDKYSSKCDWWSCGVILYVMLSGTYPFNHASTQVLYNQILTLEYSFNSSRWNNVSEDAKDLITKLLVKDPKSRYGYGDILRHSFLRKHLGGLTGV